jgi:hypothetical protein
MQETCTKAEELANAIFRGAHLDLQATAVDADEGCLLSIDGADNGLLLNQGGELLDFVQPLPHLFLVPWTRMKDGSFISR